MSLQIPTIKINEVEVEQQIVFDSNIKTTCLIPAETGEGNIPFIINNIEQLVDIIPLTENNSKYWWQAWNYLQYKNAGIYVLRPLKNTDVNFYNSFNGSTITTSSKSLLYNSDVAQSLLYTEDLASTESLRVYNKYVSNKNNIAVLICEDENNWNSSISNESIEVIRDINRFDYDVVNESLNNTYQIITKKITSNTKKYETGNNKSYLSFDGNLTYIEKNQYLRGLKDAINESFIVTNITNNVYRELAITVVNVGDKKITLSGYHDYVLVGDSISFLGFDDILTVSNVLIVEDGSFNITTVLTLNLITINSRNITTSDIAIIQSNTTLIQTDTNITTTNPYTTVKWLDNDWNQFIVSDITDGTFKKYNNITTVWDTISKTTNKDYYIYNLDKIYHFTTPSTFELTTKTAIPTTSDVAIIQIYSEDLYDNFGNIKSFYDVFLTNPVWENNEFGLLVLKRNDKTLLFEIADKFIVDYTNNSENLVYNNSKNIYLKTNKNYINKANTYNKSINDCIITDNTSEIYDDITRYNFSDLKECIYSIRDTNIYNIEYKIGFRYLNDNDLFNFDLASILAEDRTDITAIQSLWNETDFIGKTKSTMIQNIINTFGINGTNPKQFSKFGTYTAIFANMKLQYDIYNKKNIWLPISGDIAGLFVENENNDISTVGYNLPLKNTIKLLFNLTEDADRKTLNLNGLNNIIYDNLKQPIIFESITCTKDLYMITRELHKRRWSNKIKIWFKDNFLSSLLKIANNTTISKLNEKLNSYCRTLNVLGVIQNNFSINTFTDGTTMVVNLNITFNDIIRQIIFNIRLSGGILTISETEK